MRRGAVRILIATMVLGSAITFASSLAVHPPARSDQTYASPLEVLFSLDGTRLYVLCNQSNEVRVLNAATYAVIKISQSVARLGVFRFRRTVHGSWSPTPGTTRSPS